MSFLTNLSSDLAAITESAGQSVVSVERRRNVPASGVVWSNDGLIVSVHHALREDESIRVIFGDGKPIEASLVGRDPTTDLALVRVSKKLKTMAAWADVQDVRVGHFILSLARPGKTIQASVGIISAIGESWRTPAGGMIDRYIQADATSYPGFSGGPLVSMDANIIGINTSGLLRNTSVTVPIATVKQVVEELLSRGHIARGYLGVGVQPVRLPTELANQFGQQTGLLITSVEPGSPAEKAGLVLGDTIVSIGSEAVRQWDDLLAILGKDKIGAKVQIRTVRAGKVKEVPATISEHP